MRLNLQEAKLGLRFSVEVAISLPNEEFIHLIHPEDDNELKQLVAKASKGFKGGFAPELCKEGVGGTYFMLDEHGNYVGIFKPEDEEPYNVNNPKGFRPRRGSDIGMKQGILVGEASIRECIAYLLDHEHFSGVPPTDLVVCQHSSFNPNDNMLSRPQQESFEHDNSVTHLRVAGIKVKNKIKLGSLQKYKRHDGDAEDASRTLISRFPVEEVHKIAVLDLRLFNTDRHGGNILHREKVDDLGVVTVELIPIDHGFTIPSEFAGDTWFEWLWYPQAKVHMSDKTKSYVQSLDIEKDIALLRKRFGKTIRKEHCRILRICDMLLKKGVEKNLTPWQIGNVLCRTDLQKPSVLEDLFAEALVCTDAITAAVSNDESDDRIFLDKLSQLVDKHLLSLLV